MRTRILGRTGMSVSVLGLGTGQFGMFGKTNVDDCVKIAHAAFDAGVTLVDTADFYSFGESEDFVAKAIAGKRDKLIVSTKCGFAISSDPNERGGSRRWIMHQVDASLKRLGTDWIDLYQLHTPDPHTEIEETMAAMTDLLASGKIRAYGVSNFSGLQLAEAALRAKQAGLVAPHSEQQSYSIFRRSPEAELLPTALKYGMGVLAYSPVDGGWLSGKYRRDHAVAESVRQRLQPARFDMNQPVNQQKLDAVEKLIAIASDVGLNLQQLAVGFVLAHPAVSVALFGGNKIDYVAAYAACADVELDDETLDRIDAVIAPGVALDPAPALATSKYTRRRRPDVKAVAGSIDHIRNTVQAEKR